MTHQFNDALPQESDLRPTLTASALRPERTLGITRHYVNNETDCRP